MPINNPNGNEVSEIVLPNGNTASEVIAPDGSTVFAAIPDSAIHQWRIDESSGTTLSDTIATNDLTISGATWTATADATGGYQLSFDGVDDYADGSVMDGEITRDVDYSIGITVNPDNLTDDQAMLSHTDTGDDRFAIGIDSGANEIYAVRFDGTYIDSEQLDGTSVTTRQRVFVSWDSSADSFTLYKNGSQSSTNGNDNGTTISSTASFRLGTATDGVTPFAGLIDNPIIYDKAGGSTLATDDYELQPWS